MSTIARDLEDSVFFNFFEKIYFSNFQHFLQPVNTTVTPSINRNLQKMKEINLSLKAFSHLLEKSVQWLDPYIHDTAADQSVFCRFSSCHIHMFKGTYSFPHTITRFRNCFRLCAAAADGTDDSSVFQHNHFRTCLPRSATFLDDNGC